MRMVALRTEPMSMTAFLLDSVELTEVPLIRDPDQARVLR